MAIKMRTSPFISLKDCPADISIRITKATNTQNRVEKVDFISLDPEQERIRGEMEIECGVKYYYQRTSEMVSSEVTCTAEEAAIALACSDSEIDLAVIAKRETGKLWDDTQKEPYTKIFNTELKATRLWRVVQISRVLQRILEGKASSASGRERGICIHGNRFMTHLIFRLINPQVINDPAYDFANYSQNALPAVIEKIIPIIVREVERMFPNSLVHQLFRTFTKCRELKIEVLQSLA